MQAQEHPGPGLRLPVHLLPLPGHPDAASSRCNPIQSLHDIFLPRRADGCAVGGVLGADAVVSGVQPMMAARRYDKMRNSRPLRVLS